MSDLQRTNGMNESNPSDAALAELLTLTVEVGAATETTWAYFIESMGRQSYTPVVSGNGI